jgi:hypothetical protein
MALRLQNAYLSCIGFANAHTGARPISAGAIAAKRAMAATTGPMPTTSAVS